MKNVFEVNNKLKMINVGRDFIQDKMFSVTCMTWDNIM